VIVYVDSLPPSEVNADVAEVSTKALYSGVHTRKAQYRDVVIGNQVLSYKRK